MSLHLLPPIRKLVQKRIQTFLAAGLLALGLVTPSLTHAQSAAPLPDYVVAQFGTPPDIPEGPLSAATQSAMRVAFIDSVSQSTWGKDQDQALQDIANSGASTLLGKELPVAGIWGTLTDHLIAWDVPAPPEYLPAKREIFTKIVPGWERIFVEGDIDWRLVSWGGVLIDDRAYDTTDARRLISPTTCRWASNARYCAPLGC